jgi:hypothetical protein
MLNCVLLNVGQNRNRHLTIRCIFSTEHLASQEEALAEETKFFRVVEANLRALQPVFGVP